MCSVIPANRLSADDLAVLSSRETPNTDHDDESIDTLALDEFQPG